jgi:hypothetical protein
MKRWRLWLHIAAMKLAAWIVLIAGGIHHEEENVLEQQQSDDDATSSSTKDPATKKTFHIQVMPA